LYTVAMPYNLCAGETTDTVYMVPSVNIFGFPRDEELKTLDPCNPEIKFYNRY